MTEKEFVSLLGEQARADMTKTGILASLTTAQGIPVSYTHLTLPTICSV